MFDKRVDSRTVAATNFAFFASQEHLPRIEDVLALPSRRGQRRPGALQDVAWTWREARFFTVRRLVPG